MEDALFLDTTIQIARVTHSPETKRRIRERLAQHSRVVTSLVVRQEFRRRLLKEAKYLLEQLGRLESITRLMRHVQENLPPQQFRKKEICLATILTVDEQDGEEDRTDRLRLFLHSLLRDGLADFDEGVDRLIKDSGCACAQQPIQRKGRGGQRFEFGTDRCSRMKGECGIVEFLKNREPQARAVLARLKGLSPDEKTKELTEAECFLNRAREDVSRAPHDDPCLTVGDLIIALESAGIRSFYTLNRKESQHLCPALNQELIVRPKNAAHEDEVCPANTPAAPTSGSGSETASAASARPSPPPSEADPSAAPGPPVKGSGGAPVNKQG